MLRANPRPGSRNNGPSAPGTYMDRKMHAAPLQGLLHPGDENGDRVIAPDVLGPNRKELRRELAGLQIRHGVDHHSLKPLSWITR